MNWRLWTQGLVAAIINSASTAITVIIVDPTDFNLQAGLPKLGTVIAVAAIVGCALYLKEHPLPDLGGH
jgi:hypothetical protein